MPSVFVDTAHLVAVLMDEDGLHERALLAASDLTERGTSFVTTQFVLAELLASVSRRGSHTRRRAIRFATEFIAQRSVEVARVEDADFDAAMDLYRRRPDQRYSLTECISMILCKKLGITDVLTSDSDFTHEGLTILLGT